MTDFKYHSGLRETADWDLRHNSALHSRPTDILELTSSEIRLLALWTRDPSASKVTGRGQITEALRQVMDDNFLTVHYQLRHIFDTEAKFGPVSVLLECIKNLFSFKFLPFQCLIYAPQYQARALHAVVKRTKPDVIYLDGTRAAPFLPQLRDICPGAQFVLDMDDLMSRRWLKRQRAGIGLSFGFLERYVPRRIARAFEGRAVGRLVVHVEIRALKALELTVAPLADQVVFNSAFEARLFAQFCGRHGGRVPDTISIGPPAPRVPALSWNAKAGLRFVFLGSDRTPQNRLTIEYLVDLWRRVAPELGLYIFGVMVRPYRPAGKVCFAGYVDDVGSVYDGGTILLAPSFIRGGVKTKVIEAFAYGNPVVGTGATFEGLPLPRDYPLCLSPGEVEALVIRPQAYLGSFQVAAEIGVKLVERELNRDVFARRWSAVLAGSAARHTRSESS